MIARATAMRKAFAVVLAVSVGVVCAFKSTLRRSTVDDPDWLKESSDFFQAGVFRSAPEGSGNFEQEVEETARLLKLHPGMTYCEMGASTGLWASALAAKVMPGGQFIGSVGTNEEVPELRKTMEKAGVPATIVRGTDDTSGFPQDASCDAFMSRMSFFYVRKPDVYAAEFYAVVKPGGRMFISDHGPDVTYEGAWTGPRGIRVSEDGEMILNRVKAADEANDFKKAGFKLVEQLEWKKYYHQGYGNLFTK